ncbi:MAG: DNA polymerase IV [Actinobacteria bacterium]|nr:DNA polymerase IV [Actinomycetota bacterium]
MSRPSILHVDMDAFYASVEVAKDPTLRGKPVIVGGQGGRGVVTSASYEAREFGVTSAMPMIRARRLCPHAVYLPNDFDSYLAYSRRIRAVFMSVTPLVEPLSLDEAFLDVSGSVKLFGDPPEIGRLVKERILALGLTCTVGIAPNKFLAKLASTIAKPNGFLVIEPEEVESFLHPLPITALWGVGQQTGEALRKLGLKTVGDVATLSRRTLERAVGDALGRHLHELANGRDDRVVVPDEPAKSVGSEETFARDIDDSEEVLRELLRLADRTAGRLRAKGLCGRTVTIKVRFSNFKTITRSRTLDHELDTSFEIYDVARALYRMLDPDRPRIRLLGVSVSGVVPGPPKRQLELLEASDGKAAGDRRALAAEAMDDIRHRFGADAVTQASLLEEPRAP